MTNSMQFSLVVTEESGVMSRVIKLLMEFKYIPISRETLDSNDINEPNLVVVAKGNGSINQLLIRLEMLKGVISVFKIEDYTAIENKTQLTKSIEKSKESEKKSLFKIRNKSVNSSKTFA